MAENNWLLNDSAPVPLAQEFAAASAAKAWGWFGMPAAGEGSAFESPAAAWTETYWTPSELAFNGAESGGGTAHNVFPADTITLSDAPVKASGKSSSDTITLSDSVSKSVSRTSSDSITLSDAVVKSVGKPVADAVTLSESPSKSSGKAFSDTVTLSDATSKAVSSSISDVINLSDSPSKSLTQLQADTITLSESSSKAAGKSASDTITLSDLIGKSSSLSEADTITLSDAAAKAFGIVKSDTITLIDQSSESETNILFLSDTITLTDSPSKTIVKVSTDSISSSDEIAKLFGLNEADTIALSDIISLPGIPVAYAFSLSDSIWLSDASVQVVGSVPAVPAVSFPTQFPGLRIVYGGSEHELSMVAESNAPAGMGGVLKIRKNGVNYAVYLVEANDAHASRLRIKTATGTKAVRLKT